MDLNELINISTNAAHERRFLKDLNDGFESFSKPLIAAVTGYAVSTPSMIDI
jgi:enoyl-CoA hydratase/carnithine racemase